MLILIHNGKLYFGTKRIIGKRAMVKTHHIPRAVKRDNTIIWTCYPYHIGVSENPKKSALCNPKFKVTVQYDTVTGGMFIEYPGAPEKDRSVREYLDIDSDFTYYEYGWEVGEILRIRLLSHPKETIEEALESLSTLSSDVPCGVTFHVWDIPKPEQVLELLPANKVITTNTRVVSEVKPTVKGKKSK